MNHQVSPRTPLRHVLGTCPPRLLPLAAMLALGLGAGAPPLRAQQPPSRDSLRQLVRDRQVFALERLLAADSTLGGSERSCLYGQVHAAFRRSDEAIASLRRCLDEVPDTSLQRQALERLGPSYMAAGRFAEAAEAMTLLLARFGSGATEDSLGWESGRSVMRVLGQGMPLRVASRTPARVRAERNRFGMLLVPVAVNGRAEELLLDTGAGLSVLMASLAESLGVRLVPGTVSVSGGTGVRMAARLGIARLEIAGITLEDVPFLVLPDSVLNVRAGPIQLQVRGIVGMPVLVALEEFSFTADGWLDVPATPRLSGPANLAMDGQRLLVEATLEGRAGVFSLDTGARSTTLYPPARVLLGDRSAAGEAGTIQLGSAGGTRAYSVVRLTAVTLGIGDTSITLRQLPLLAEASSARFRYAAGNVGQDVLGAFPVATYNLRHMILRLGAADPR